MIYGIGADIVEKERIRAILDRFGDRFAMKILSPGELLEFGESADRTSFIAKRFAAKEAFSKAMGTGLRTPLTLCGIGVENDELGKPGFVFCPEISGHLKKIGVSGHHLSISDERNLACAFVVLEKE